MLEGNELEGKIGAVGGYFVDVSANGELKTGVQVNIIGLLRYLALKTDNKLDDKLVDMVEAALVPKSV